MSTWPATAIVRATELAQAQCTTAEISGALAVEHERTMDDADAFIEEHAEQLQAWRLRGRAQLRTKLQRIADGDPELGKKLTRTNIAALELFGRQHLGYTSTGVDEDMRKRIEAMERRIAKNGGKLVAV